MAKSNQYLKKYIYVHVLKQAVVAIVSFFYVSSMVWAGDTEVCFSPRGNCAREIIQELAGAKKTIDLAIYYLTSKALADMLVEMKGRGVAVRVYLDEGQETSKHAKAQYIKSHGVMIKFESGSGLMHNKFCVIDGRTVITGSYNWTKNAETRNDENVIVLHDPDVAMIYQRKFEEYWTGGVSAGGERAGIPEDRKNSHDERSPVVLRDFDPQEGPQAFDMPEGLLALARPPLLNFDIDAGQEFEDTEDDELESGDFKFFTTTARVAQQISPRFDYAAGMKQRWRDYSEKNRDNQSNTVFFDLSYKLAKPLSLSAGIEEDIKRYKDFDYDYNRFGLWSRLKWKVVPWETYFKAGYQRKNYQDVDADKQDVIYEAGASRFLFSKDNKVDFRYKVATRQYDRVGKDDKVRQSVHIGMEYQF